MPMVRVHRRVMGGAAVTRSACEAASRLGVVLDDLAGPRAKPATLKLDLGRGACVLVTGPSGSGKSTLLGDIERAVIDAGGEVVKPPARLRANRCAVDVVPGADVERRMRLLGSAGLGEADAMVRPIGVLSAGQRERVKLAVAMARTERAAVRARRRGRWVALLVDELGSLLDGATGRGVARCLTRFAQRLPDARVVVATARDDVAAHLHTTTALRCASGGAIQIVEGGRQAIAREWRMEEGSLRDWAALAHLHYRPGEPRGVERVLVAREPVWGERVGVLVVSRPVLNAAWRTLAWPGLFDTGRAAADAARVNGLLRCISRVVVTPERRSSGVARGLVEAYLREPLTLCTEAVAAMGRSCPFFERAGMRAYPTPVSGRHARLADALEHAGVEPWRLATPGLAYDRAVRTAGAAFVDRELRLWARGSRATRRHADASGRSLMELAARRVGARPVAYAYRAGPQQATERA